MKVLFHGGHHRENAVGGRDRVEDPSNLTPRMSENIPPSKERSSVSAGATVIM